MELIIEIYLGTLLTSCPFSAYGFEINISIVHVLVHSIYIIIVYLSSYIGRAKLEYLLMIMNRLYLQIKIHCFCI